MGTVEFLEDPGDSVWRTEWRRLEQVGRCQIGGIWGASKDSLELKGSGRDKEMDKASSRVLCNEERSTEWGCNVDAWWLTRHID